MTAAPPSLASIAAQQWRDRAACSGTDPLLWHPPAGEQYGEFVEAARYICAACPVLAECFTWALTEDDRHAVIAGLTFRERRRLQRESA